MSVTVTGTELVIGNLKRIKKKQIDDVVKGIGVICSLISNHAKENHPGKGTISMWAATRAINPDGTPRYADQTGALTGSIQALRPSIKPHGIEGEVTTGKGVKMVKYGAAVEFGTRTARPHPFMRPAAFAVSGQAAEIIARALKK